MYPLFPTSYKAEYSSSFYSNVGDKRGGAVETKKKTSLLARIFKKNKPEAAVMAIVAKKVTFSSGNEVHNYPPEYSKATSEKVQKAAESVPLLLPLLSITTIIPVCKPLWNKVTLVADLENRVFGKHVLVRKNKTLLPSLVADLKGYLRSHPHNFDEVVHLMPDLMLKDPEFARALLQSNFDIKLEDLKDHLQEIAHLNITKEETKLLAEYLDVSEDQTDGLSLKQKRIALLYNEFAFATSRIDSFRCVNATATIQLAQKSADQNERFSHIDSSGLEILNEPYLTIEEKAYLSELPVVLTNLPGQSALNQLLSQPLDIGQLKTLIRIGKDLYMAKEGLMPDPALIEGNKRRGNLGEIGYFIALSSDSLPKIYLTSDVLGVGSSKKVKKAFFLNDNRLVSLSEVNMRTIKSKYFSARERRLRALTVSAEFKNEQRKLLAIHAAIVGKPYVIEPNDVLEMTDKPNVMISELYHSSGISDELLKSPIELKIVIMHAWAAGLTQIHAGGFVHSDFKPANTLIKGDIKHPEAGFKVVVTDLGLAVDLKTGKIRGGSFLYSAPETKLAKSPRAQSHVDSWSLGISMIELLLPLSRQGLSKDYHNPISIITQCTPHTPQLILDTQFEIVRTLLMRDNPNPQKVYDIMDEVKRLLMIAPDERDLPVVLKNLEKMTLT